MGLPKSSREGGTVDAEDDTDKFDTVSCIDIIVEDTESDGETIGDGVNEKQVHKKEICEGMSKPL